MGRPREFNVDDAIKKATILFWKKGYEGTSLSDLKKAMHITTPSFYHAFGSKEELFKRAVDFYRTAYQGLHIEEALSEATPKGVADKILYGFANSFTDPDLPVGCLGMNCALPIVGANDPRREYLAFLRGEVRTMLTRRFKKDKSAGRLLSNTDPEALARLIMTVVWGMAVEAQSGATRKDLYRMLKVALKTLPLP